MKLSVNLVTFLLCIYNIILGYVIAQSASGTDKLVLLSFIAVDYVIIFYLISTIIRSRSYNGVIRTRRRRR